MNRMTRAAGLLTICMLMAVSVGAQESRKPTNEPKKAHVMVLGAFHMANPGHDIFNLKVDDVLAEKRQKEIAETVAALAKFRPTKIAIESDPGGKRVQQYQDYRDGKYA